MPYTYLAVAVVVALRTERVEARDGQPELPEAAAEGEDVDAIDGAPHLQPGEALDQRPQPREVARPPEHEQPLAAREEDRQRREVVVDVVLVDAPLVEPEVHLQSGGNQEAPGRQSGGNREAIRRSTPCRARGAPVHMPCTRAMRTGVHMHAEPEAHLDLRASRGGAAAAAAAASSDVDASDGAKAGDRACGAAGGHAADRAGPERVGGLEAHAHPLAQRGPLLRPAVGPRVRDNGVHVRGCTS